MSFLNSMRFGVWFLHAGLDFWNAICSKIAKLEEELRLVNNALKTYEVNEEKVTVTRSKWTIFLYVHLHITIVHIALSMLSFYTFNHIT